MANRCASVDPTWAHLPTPAPTHTAHAARHYYFSSLSPAAAFENEALTSALRASMAPPAHANTVDAAAPASSFSSPATPSSSTTSSELLSACSGGGHHDAPAAPAAASTRPARAGRALAGGPRAGRVTKQRKPRPSRRPQTTYITADPANFRRMVQETTGLPVVHDHVPGASSSFHGAASEAVPNWTTTPAPACVLPTLDTSAFLLDRAAAVPAALKEKSPACGGHGHASAATDGADAVAAAAAGNDGSLTALLELEAPVCAAAGEYECAFPTLESWWMI